MNGPKIVFRIGPVLVTETIINMWIIMALIVAVCIWLAHDLRVRPVTRRQIVAEKLVGMVYGMVKDTMGERCMAFAPYIGTLFTVSIIGSLSSLLGLRPYTADLSVTVGWALVTFVLVQGNSIRYNGLWGWIKGFADPVPFMLPINIVSEIATPISISFRHFGNIAAGMVITSLMYTFLAYVSSLIIGAVPNAFLSSIPILQVGLPAFLSVYFDLLTSFMQAYIICMLTMIYVSNVIPEKNN